jgi:hypothetical protein
MIVLGAGFKTQAKAKPAASPTARKIAELDFIISIIELLICLFRKICGLKLAS